MELNRGRKRMNTMIKLYLFVYIFFFGAGISLCHMPDNDNSTNVFLEQCRRDCAINKNMMLCGKYIAVKWINDVIQEKEYSYGPFKIIKIPRIQSGRLLPEILRTKTSNIAETLYFIREAAEDLLTRRAIVYTVEQSPGAQIFKNGLMVLDDDELSHVRKSRTFEASQGSFRIFKKKKNIILPILILLNLLKLKLLIFPIFLGVHFIKKLLILGSLLLPSILSHLKICKIAQQPFPYHHWQPPGAEYALDFSHAYGQQDSWDHRNDVPGNAYDSYYDHSLYNPFSYYFQNYNKDRR